MITQWNDTEDDLLQGLPLRAQVIYLRGLRRFMNYKTGVVGGIDRRISLTMLGEIACEEFNRKLQSPTKDGVRSSLEQLKRVGLIERIEDKDYLIFFLPKASVNNFAQNNNPTTTPQQPHNNPTHSPTPNHSNGAALIGEQRTAQNGAILEGGLTTPHIRITDNGYTDNSLSNEREYAGESKKPKFAVPDFVNPVAWSEFEQHRKEIKKPLSDLARTKAVNSLNGLTFEQQQEVVDYSVQGRYPGLFPDRVKNKSGGVVRPFQQPTKAQVISERNQQTMQRMMEKYGVEDAAG